MIAWKVADKNGGSDTGRGTFRVDNTAPTVETLDQKATTPVAAAFASLAAPANLVLKSGGTLLAGTFKDPGLGRGETYRGTATVTRRGGTPTTVPVAVSRSGQFEFGYAFGQSGLYDVAVTIDDDMGGKPTPKSIVVEVPDTTPPAAPGFSRAGAVVSVTGLEPQATWQYSLDAGASWQAGANGRFGIPAAAFPAGQIQIRQRDPAGNTSPPTLLPNVSLAVTSLVTDTFNRPDSTLLGTATGASAAWTVVSGGFKIASNTIQSTAAESLALLPATFAEANARVEAQFDIAAVAAAGTSAGVVARATGSGSSASMIIGMVSRTSGGLRAEIWRQRNGSRTLLASAAVATVTGTIRLDAVGGMLSLAVNGSLVTSALDSSPDAVLTPGSAGIRLVGSGVKADAFTAARLTQ
jgi:hypothetical protein